MREPACAYSARIPKNTRPCAHATLYKGKHSAALQSGAMRSIFRRSGCLAPSHEGMQ